MRSVLLRFAAREAAKFTAVVVLPTPPFWFATDIMRPKVAPRGGNVAELRSLCNVFHVEQSCAETRNSVPRETFSFRIGVLQSKQIFDLS